MPKRLNGTVFNDLRWPRSYISRFQWHGPLVLCVLWDFLIKPYVCIWQLSFWSSQSSINWTCDWTGRTVLSGYQNLCAIPPTRWGI